MLRLSLLAALWIAALAAASAYALT